MSSRGEAGMLDEKIPAQRAESRRVAGKGVRKKSREILRRDLKQGRAFGIVFTSPV